MNNNLLGGRGQCDKCGEWHNNVSYHSEHECKNIEKSKESKLLDKILNEIEADENVAKLSYKDLGDYILQEYWGREEWGGYSCAVLDRVIRILFELNDDYGVYPDRNVEAPEFDYLSDGCDPKICEKLNNKRKNEKNIPDII